mmetsp:Transcript_41320/g.90227  ORF Transcript_41320/g.90227 Transcript_41320/m.90227 type:complete len:226 (-) Transcript_41320:62-739(-)
MVTTLRGLLCIVFWCGTPVPSFAGGGSSGWLMAAKSKVCDKLIQKRMGHIRETLNTTVKDHCDSLTSGAGILWFWHAGGNIKGESKEVNSCCTKKGQELQDKLIEDQEIMKKTYCMRIYLWRNIKPKMRKALAASEGEATTDLEKGLKDLDTCKEEGKKLALAAADKITGNFELAPPLTSDGSSFAGVVVLTGVVASTIVAGAIIMRWRRGVLRLDEESMVQLYE